MQGRPRFNPTNPSSSQASSVSNSQSSSIKDTTAQQGLLFSPTFQCWTTSDFYRIVLHELQTISTSIDACSASTRQIVWKQLFTLIGCSDRECDNRFGPLLSSWMTSSTLDVLAIELLYVAFAQTIVKYPRLLSPDSDSSFSSLSAMPNDASTGSVNLTQLLRLNIDQTKAMAEGLQNTLQIPSASASSSPSSASSPSSPPSSHSPASPLPASPPTTSSSTRSMNSSQHYQHHQHSVPLPPPYAYSQFSSAPSSKMPPLPHHGHPSLPAQPVVYTFPPVADRLSHPTRPHFAGQKRKEADFYHGEKNLMVSAPEDSHKFSEKKRRYTKNKYSMGAISSYIAVSPSTGPSPLISSSSSSASPTKPKTQIDLTSDKSSSLRINGKDKESKGVKEGSSNTSGDSKLADLSIPPSSNEHSWQMLMMLREWMYQLDNLPLSQKHLLWDTCQLLTPFPEFTSFKSLILSWTANPILHSDALLALFSAIGYLRLHGMIQQDFYIKKEPIFHHNGYSPHLIAYPLLNLEQFLPAIKAIRDGNRSSEKHQDGDEAHDDQREDSADDDGSEGEELSSNSNQNPPHTDTSQSL